MLKVLYQDEHYLAVDKPSGLLVHRTEWANSERESAMTILRDQIGQWVYPIHRLDRATSGVLLFATSPEAAEALSKSFRAHEVQKKYLAVVRGYTAERGEIERELKRNPEKKGSPLLEAKTRYFRRATAEVPFAVGRYSTARYSLVEVEILTGRLHQIRRHMASIAHPLIGDTVYGDGKHNRLFREKYLINRLLLSAFQVRFIHPYSKQPIQLDAESNLQFLQDLQALAWKFDGQ